MSRKTPILLRNGPMSGEVYAVHRYSHKRVRGHDVIAAAVDGKQKVTADFDALLIEALLDPDSPDIIAILDGAADGEFLNDEYRKQIRGFHDRLKAIVVRHNERGHGAA